MKRHLVAAAVIAASPLGIFAESSSTNRVAELPTVVVEATRLGQTPDEMPAYVEVVSRRAIAESGAGDLAELLRTKTTSLNLVSMVSGNPAFAAVAPAGYGENGWGRFLVMVDGQRLNYPDMAAPLLSQIDLGGVSQIEILHGSQCVLQGDGASAGALNIVTEPPDYEHHGKVEVHAGNFDSYGARAASRGGDEAEGLKWWSSGGWNRSRGFRENSGWQIWNLSGGLKKEWSNGSYLRTSAFWSDSSYDLPGPAEAPTPEDWARRRTVGLSSTFNGVINDENRIKVDFLSSMSLSRAFYKSSSPYYGDTRLVQDVYSHELTPQWICTAPLGWLDNELIAGATYRLEQSYHYLHGTRHALAFFAQDTLYLTDTLALEAGARGQRTQNENTWAGDLALLFRPVEDLKTYVRASRFFRYPFLDETMLDAFWNPVGIPEPERGASVNVGAEWRFWEEFSAFADAGVSETTDEIFYDPTRYSNINAPDDVCRGTLTLGLTWEREKVVALSLGCTYTDATFDGGTYDGNRVPFVSKVTAQANGRVWLWDEFSVLGGYRFLSPRYGVSDFDNAGERMPSLSLFNLGCRYEPTVAWLKGFYASVMINNLFDRDYDEYLSWGTHYPAPGRSMTVTLGFEF